MKLIRNDKESAVSPVIGVMLMLVVTIIIAGTITVFATGIMPTNSGTPTAVFLNTEYDNNGGSYLTNLTFAHKGGDPIAISDLEVVLESYGTTRTITPKDLKCVSGKVAVASGDELVANATSAGLMVSDSHGKYVGSKLNYKIVYSPSDNVVSAGEIILL